MDTKPINPLTAHFRQPAIYFRLPSKGQFWESGLNMPPAGDIPVYPMTAKDEITLRTPDALLNGQGVIDVIESCCPNIEDAWQMPSIDVDALLIAIRIASYGNEMPFETTCPHCKEENNYDVDLMKILDSIDPPDYSVKVQHGTVKIKLNPQKYKSLNETGQIRYEEERTLATLANDTLSEEEKVIQYKNHLERLVKLNTKVFVDSTEYIEIVSSNTVVTDHTHIEEYYNNCEAEVCKAVKDQLDEFNKQGGVPPVPVTCGACTGSFAVPLAFDYATFFGTGS
jgi:hypothetical protein